MQILKKSFGMYETNCYIIRTNTSDNHQEWIIDPGMGACEWIMKECKNPQAILLTHGHFDHIFDVAKLKQSLPHLSVYCPEQDAFMLESDCFNTGITPCKPDYLVNNNKSKTTISISGLDFIFYHFPGHTPGCSIIECNEAIFSGDFIFKRSIGRFDFPYSNKQDMRESLQKFQNIQASKDKIIYPGHGENTSLFQEQQNTHFWLKKI